MFFTDEREQFFKPLTGKYREQVVECVRLLHERLYSAKADYGESLKRDQVLDVFKNPHTEALHDRQSAVLHQQLGQPRSRPARVAASLSLSLVCVAAALQRAVARGAVL